MAKIGNLPKRWHDKDADQLERENVMRLTPLDIWDVTTFDANLLHALRSRAELVKEYFTTQDEIMKEYVNATAWQPQRDNPLARDFQAFQEDLMPLLHERAMRGWHYTRLTDREVARFQEDGIQLATLASLSLRLESVVQEDLLSQDQTTELFKASQFHHPQMAAVRLDRFWMMVKPVPIDHGGVTYLLNYWGGEAVSMGMEDEQNSPLRLIGRARVLEVAVELKQTNDTYAAATAAVRTFGQSLGCKTDRLGFDLYAKASLPPSAIQRILTEGEADFTNLGTVYPAAVASPHPDE